MDKVFFLSLVAVLASQVAAEKFTNNRFCRPVYVSGGSYAPRAERNLYPVNASITYSCFETHELVGEPVVTCTPLGWDRNPPTCRLQSGVTCPRVPGDDADFDNGIIEPFGIRLFTPGQKQWFGCLAGYDIRRGDKKDITCLSTGEWSDPVPLCVVARPTCGPLQAPENGRASDNNLEYNVGDIVSFECQPPYSIVGRSRLVCLPSGWSSEEPTCGDPRCRRPQRPNRGFFTPALDFYDVGATVQFGCFVNYRLSTDVSTITCLQTGQWSATEPDCVAVTCNPLNPPDFGSLIPERDEYNVNSQIIFSCDGFYTLVGARRVTCQASGTWSADVPICQAAQCGRPVIDNGSFRENKDKYDVGETVTFECESEYELRGVETLTCQQNGRWSGNFPECRAIRCNRPTIENGGFEEDKVTYRTGEDVTFFCIEGYILVGERTAVCNGNNGWSVDFPICNRQQCRRPDFPQGALTPDVTLYNFRATLDFECNIGYEINGRDRLRCGLNGQWSDLIPTCEPVRCVRPIFENGQISPDSQDYAVGTRLEFVCDNGYALDGGISLVVCQNNREWSNPIPTCRQLSCKRPILRRGSFRPDQARYGPGASVRFRCNNNYELNGARVVNCLDTEEWDAAFPTCDPIQCARPVVPNGIPSPNKDLYDVSEDVTYTCPFGYVLVGAATLTCRNDRTWSEEFPRCERVRCSRPDFPNGVLTRDQEFYNVNAVVIFRCNVGYTLDGANSLTCQENGQFTPRVPVCRRNRCSRPSPFDNGSFMEDKLTYNPGETVVFSCNTGYFRVGLASVTCGTEGDWSADFPFCVAFTCDQPFIDNGSFQENKDSYNLGEVVSFICDEGYTLQGTSTSVTCEGEGDWSDVFPTCQKNRCRREDVANSILSDSKTLFDAGEFLTINCVTGYEIVGESVLVCQNDGSWSDPFPTCRPIRCERPSLPNGRLDPSRATYPTQLEITFICNIGYSLDGAERAICRNNGQWSEIIPTCEPVTCNRPTFEKGTFEEDKDSYTVGERVTFTCDQGYRLVGREQLRCRNVGLWSGDFPTCEPLRCARPIFPRGTLDRDQTSYAVGESVRFTCNVGYELVGLEVLECRNNRVWSGDFPTCRPVRCSRPEIDNGRFERDQDSYIVGNVVRFFCDDNFRLVGARVITCQVTQRWSDDFPTCEPVTCSRPTIDNGSFEDDDLQSYFVSVTVTFQCDEGYVLNGEEIVTCNNNGGVGVWSEEFPVCEALACVRPRFDPDRGTFTPNVISYPVDSTVTFECDEQYVLTGARQIRCLVIGRWSDEFPTCETNTCTRPSITDGSFTEDKESYNPGESVRFECDDGFRISRRNADVLCLSSGEWSDDFPTCSLITCREPFINPNTGSFTPTLERYVIRTDVTFECNNGYRLRGAETISCSVIGLWSDEFPVCIPNRCRRPSASEPLSFTPSRLFYSTGDIISFSCSHGFLLVGSQSLTCLPDGQFNNVPPTCQEVVRCQHPDPEPANSLTSSFQEFYNVGDTITYMCQTGYAGSGDATVTCQDNGLFSSTSFTCTFIEEDCARPYTPMGQSVSPDQEIYAPGTIVTFSCDAGQEIEGDEQRTCRPNGQFTGNTPSCVRVQRRSCFNRCDEQYDPSQLCICTFWCAEAGLCCSDHAQVCGSSFDPFG